jgi:hypothetical protein
MLNYRMDSVEGQPSTPSTAGTEGDAPIKTELATPTTPIPKKRRWGTSQGSKATNKAPAVAISTDVLKVCEEKGYNYAPYGH